MKKVFFVFLPVLILVSQPFVFAQNQLPALLRDEFALGLTPSLKSVGMGGAYVGVDGPQSMNPASLSSVDWIEGTLRYGFYDLDQGPNAHRGRLDGIVPAPYIGGAARLMIDGMQSESAENTRLPGNAPIEFDEVTLGLQYGRNITEWAAIGFGAYPYEKANVDMITPGGTVHTEGLSQIGSTQLGVLFRPHEKVNIGAQFIYIKDDLEAWLPGGGHMGDNFDIHYYTMGISVTPFDGTLLALDYWNGEAEGDVSPGVAFDVDIDRWNFGIQQRVCDHFDVRLGSNNGGVTTGFTIHVRENMDVDYAYMNEALNDKASVFGQTQFHGVSFTYRF